MLSILAGTIIGLLVVVAGFYLIRFGSELKKMAPLSTGQVADGIYAIRDKYVNLYIVREGDGCVAIDAGTSLRSVERELKKLNIDANGVSGVFLTHTDRDHVAALGLFRAAKVHISGPEEQMLNGTTRRTLVFRNRLPAEYEILADNEAVTVAGIRVKPILTPGHTPGSTCYVVDDRYLFSGDTVSLKGGRARIFSRFFNMDTETQTKSIKRISNIPGIELVLTAHHGLTHNYQKAFEKWNG